jgi:phosphohistidine phosphatase
MKTLHLMRHAKSSWEDAGASDHDRALTASGREAAGLVANYLAAALSEVELVLCSSALRTCQTLDALRPVLAAETVIRIEDELYEAGAADLLRRLRQVDGATPATLVVGHNPTMQNLTLELASEGDPAAMERIRTKFPTAALATLTFGETWSQLDRGAARLESFNTPGALRRGT